MDIPRIGLMIFALLLARAIFMTLRCGEIRMDSIQITANRTTDPAGFWKIVAIQTATFAFLIWLVAQ